MKNKVSKTPRGEQRPKYERGKGIVWACLRYPPALSDNPGRNELRAYTDRLNNGQTFLTGGQLPPVLRERFSETHSSWVHSGNPVFHIVHILQYFSFGFYPPVSSWLVWLLPALREFHSSQNPKPSSIDQSLRLANPSDIFRRYSKYLLQRKAMIGLRFGLMQGLSVKAAADAAFKVGGHLTGFSSSASMRQRYYKDGWPDFFDETLQYFSGQPSDLSQFYGPAPCLELTARYPTHEELHNTTIEGISRLIRQQPYRLIDDIPGYESTLVALHRHEHDRDPLGSLDILLWFDHHGFYPPATVLLWIIRACSDFFHSRGSKCFYECLGFKRGVNPWIHAKTDFAKSVLAAQNLAAQHCGYSATEAANAQAGYAERLDEYHPLRDPEKLRQNVYSYKSRLEQSGVLEKVLLHPEEYITPLK